MGPLGVCVERTASLPQPPSVDFPTTRAKPPRADPPGACGSATLSPSLAFIQLSLCPPASTTLSSLSATERSEGTEAGGRREREGREAPLQGYIS